MNESNDLKYEWFIYNNALYFIKEKSKMNKIKNFTKMYFENCFQSRKLKSLNQAPQGEWFFFFFLDFKSSKLVFKMCYQAA